MQHIINDDELLIIEQALIHADKHSKNWYRDELFTEIRSRKISPEWIDIKERMPELDKSTPQSQTRKIHVWTIKVDVWACNSEGGRRYTNVTYTYSNNTWQCSNNSGDNHIEALGELKVTHWRYLPESPN